MFGFIRKKTILKEMDKIKEANRREMLYTIFPAITDEQKILNGYSTGYEDGTDNFYNRLLYKLGMKHNL